MAHKDGEDAMTQTVDDMSVKYMRGLVDGTASIPHAAAEKSLSLPTLSAPVTRDRSPRRSFPADFLR
jgi:hypothetical protein